jgi:fido (protein-threonine AMPylation protein)
MQIKPLTKRQRAIITIIQRLDHAQTKNITQEIQVHFDQATRITIIRDLNSLVRQKLIQKHGEGRGVWYQSLTPDLLTPFDPEEYFKIEPDRRIIKKDTANFADYKNWAKIFDDGELVQLAKLTGKYLAHFKSYKDNKLARELERIMIEFSWKSSHIEGNTYSLLDTEQLIKSTIEAKDHPHEEAVMILNHKTALDYIWKNSADFKTINLRKIEEIHSLVVKNMGVKTGLRHGPVGIIGTTYRPFDNIYQIREAIEQLCGLINRQKNPFIKAFIVTVGLAYIQPFEDGNKRTSRLIGNAILLAFHCCPLSYRSINEIEYKKAIILFYEQHSLVLLKKLFVEQYEFAVNNYFL